MSVDGFQQCHKIRQTSRLAADCHSLPRSLRDKLETLAQRAEVLVDQAIADPSVRKRMTGKYMFDVFGGNGFLTQATNQLGLRGSVLDTTVGLRYGVTQPIVLTRMRQDVFAGKCVAGMISLPRQHTSCSSKIFRQCRHRKFA